MIARLERPLGRADREKMATPIAERADRENFWGLCLSLK
jgi:hypothetical protein